MIVQRKQRTCVIHSIFILTIIPLKNSDIPLKKFCLPKFIIFIDNFVQTPAGRTEINDI